jgi:hypothetical protein
MGVFDNVRGRDEGGRFTSTVVDSGTTTYEEKHARTAEAGTERADSNIADTPAYEADTDDGLENSFGVRGIEDDAKEAERNPDHVTSQAGLGQQKAEAAALVWSRPVVFGLYAW